VTENVLVAPAAGSASRWNLRGLSVISFAHGLSDFYSGAVPFIIYFVVTRGHLSPAYQGALGFVWYLTSSVVQPLFGAYSDRRGKWWFLPAAVLLTVVAVSLAGTVHSIVALAACIVLGGFGSAIMHPEAGKYSAMLSGARKAGGISIFQIGGQIGYAIGPAVVAALLARYGGEGTLWLIVPGAVATAALFVAMRRVDRSAVRAHRRDASAAHTAAVRPDRFGVSLLVAGTALRYFTAAAFMTYLPNLLVARGATLPAAIGLLAGGYLADRWGASAVAIASLCAAAPCFVGFFALSGFWSIALLLLAGVMLAVQNAPGVALVQSMLPRNLGMALGLMNGVAFGVGSALVATVGLAVARYGAGTALEAVSIVPLFAALPFVFVARRRMRTR